MIIDKNYILIRLANLLDSGRLSNERSIKSYSQYKKIFHGLWNSKLFIIMIFKGVIIGYNNWRSLKNRMIYPQNQYVFDFLKYIFTNEYHFDTSMYFQAEDDSAIQSYIDNRLKSLLSGRPVGTMYAEIMNDAQLKDFLAFKSLQRMIKRDNKFYKIAYNNKLFYFLNNQSDINPSVLIYHYGLKTISDEAKNYMAGKDFLDGGAYLGDTSLMLLSYRPRMIYAYEPVYYCQLEEIIKVQGEGKVYVSSKGLGAKKMSANISISESGSSVVHAFNAGVPRKEIDITSIDIECMDKIIGLIKLDVEGYEYSVIMGGLETIRRDSPILLISIYHTGKDFFEIPPLIQKVVPSYRFRFIDNNPSSASYEKIIIGYNSDKLKL
jgi:FkbM family methyltransferase